MLGKLPKESLQGFKILPSVNFPANQQQEILRAMLKSPFKHLLLKTPLWQYAMSTTPKSLPKGLKDSECKKGMLTIWPCTPCVPLINLHEKSDTKQIKVKLPGRTDFQMFAFSQRDQQRIPSPGHHSQASPRTEGDNPRHWESIWDCLISQEAVRAAPRGSQERQG